MALPANATRTLDAMEESLVAIGERLSLDDAVEFFQGALGRVHWAIVKSSPRRGAAFHPERGHWTDWLELRDATDAATEAFADALEGDEDEDDEDEDD